MLFVNDYLSSDHWTIDDWASETLVLSGVAILKEVCDISSFLTGDLLAWILAEETSWSGGFIGT